MASKLLVVFGATGNQGGSIIRTVLADPVLSTLYKIRGVTRDTTKPAATALAAQGIELVQADLDDPASLSSALSSAHTIFAMTQSHYDDQIRTREVRQGKLIADTAVAAGAQFLIWSTQPAASEISGGKLPIAPYDAKHDVAAYIRTLPISSAFFVPGCFMQNVASPLMGPVPSPAGDGSFVLANIVSGGLKWAWIDVAGDTGRFVAPLLREPERYAGAEIFAASGLWSLDEVAGMIERKTGKTVRYVRMPEEQFRGFLPPAAADDLCNMFKLAEEYQGNFGPGTGEKVEWAIKQAGSGLKEMEQFVAENVKLR